MASRPPTVVVDTSVYSSNLVRNTYAIAELYKPFLAGRRYLISYQTAAEIRFGAARSNWGAHRMSRLEEHLGRAEIVWVGPELVTQYVDLRVSCERHGHALAQREHDADRWIASTALRLGVPLVSHDNIFEDTPGLILETALRRTSG